MKRCLVFLALTAILGLLGQPLLWAQTSSSPAPKTFGPFGKTLIIYYSQTGVTDKVVNIITESIPADVLKLEPTEELPHEEKALIEVMTPHWKNKTTSLPVKNAPPDVSSYDLIIFGGPVWFSRPALPVLGFLEKMDFQGKPVAIFGSSGSGPGAALKILAQSLKNAQIQPGGEIFDRKVVQSAGFREAVESWLAKIPPQKAQN
jgi:flavodoxin